MLALELPEPSGELARLSTLQAVGWRLKSPSCAGQRVTAGPARVTKSTTARSASSIVCMADSFDDMLAPQAPSGEVTAFYTLTEIALGCEDAPVFEMKFAGKGNRGYQSATIKLTNDPRLRASGKMTEHRLEDIRDIEAKLFAKHVIVGWKNVYKGGQPSPCTYENALELLRALYNRRPDIFQMITAFAREPENFLDASPTAGADLGKG